jgi:peptide/nickel transport system substrate-binding protein
MGSIPDGSCEDKTFRKDEPASGKIHPNDCHLLLHIEMVGPMKKITLLLLFMFVLSACQFSNISRAATPTGEIATFIPLSSPTPTPPRTLTVCLGQEPNTLYPFGGPNAAARSVLAAVYDGPIDTVGYEYQPVILAQLPSQSNGDMQITKVSVHSGGQVVDANGDVVLLELGAKVRPASCRADDCAIVYDGVSALEMDQMIVTFRIRPDVTWADGTPLTADDSAYGFSLASDASAVGSTYVIDRTQTYEAADATTVQWWGLPGFIDPTYFTNFFTPAPKHMWGQMTPNPEQLKQSDIASRSPLGWGPYVIKEWLAADHITLTKNPYYFRAGAGFPKFDTLTFRFIADPNEALSELVADRCDVLDPTVRLDGLVGLLQEMERGAQAQSYITPGMTIEWLGLGIVPGSYDDGYDTLYARDRQDIFADPRTRQAIAMCVDRQKIVDTVLFGYTSVPASYLPPEHPLYSGNIAAYPFDPVTAADLLEQVGWRDIDGNPATPLSAVSVKNVSAGTTLLLNYYTTTATQRRQVVDILTQSLAQCGIGLNVQYLSQNDLYAPGPDGVLFGRRFDMAEYAMGVDGFEPPCSWFTGTEIPNAANHWIGTNVSGFKNAEFDSACRTAAGALPDEKAYTDSHRIAQEIFANNIPSIPLYFRLKVAAARPDFCNFALDATGDPLWNLEAFDYGGTCQP